MKGNFNWIGFLLIFLLAVAGCGGGEGGSPGSSGSNDTGVLITAVSVEGETTPTDETPDLDANVHICPSGDFEEGLFRVAATINISATALNADPAFNPFPATVEQCTITYKKAVEDPSAPILRDWTVFPNCPIDEGENSCLTQLIDIQRKNDYWNALLGGVNLPAEYPTHYVAVYYCKYKNIYNETGYFQTEYDIWLADFETC